MDKGISKAQYNPELTSGKHAVEITHVTNEELDILYVTFALF